MIGGKLATIVKSLHHAIQRGEARRTCCMISMSSAVYNVAAMLIDEEVEAEFLDEIWHRNEDES